MFHVLMVCTGNTCRSSMAEYLLKHIIAKRGAMDRICVSSAGTAALDGDYASLQAVATLREKGIELSEHRARCVGMPLVANADLILTMTAGHKRTLVAKIPAAAAKTFTLSEFAGDCPAVDVADPYGGSTAVYRNCSLQLERLLDKIWPKIVDLAGKGSPV